MSLPPGYLGRAPRYEDAAEIAAVINACALVDTGESGCVVEDIYQEWRNLDPSRDAYVVTDNDKVVAYSRLSYSGNGRFDIRGYVLPEHAGRGIGTLLLHQVERRTREHFNEVPEDIQIVMIHGIDQRNALASRLFEAQGFELKRHYYRMILELIEEPPMPTWPDDIYVRSFVLGQDEGTAFEAVEDALRDMWGRPPGTFERFVQRTQAKDFNPNLWLLAFAGDLPAGFALCGQREDKGWVGSLGVGRAWRKRGLGSALLYQAFSVLYRRDVSRVELTVDTDSPTGALRLYQRAGMHADQTMLLYGKVLRPGREYLAQEAE